MKLIGVDDAGRGPVLGPMTLGAVLIEEEDNKDLKALGIRDSKLIYPKERKLLGKAVKEKYKHEIITISPKEIDDFPNLNNLEAVKSAMIVNKLMQDVDERVRVIVDCPSVNTNAWGDLFFSFLVKKDLVEMVCMHKADLKHLVVGAASIIAKEKREEEVKRLKVELGINFGSGYPADPRTKEFMVKNFGDVKYDKLIRKSWSTYKKLADKMDQKKLFYL